MYKMYFRKIAYFILDSIYIYLDKSFIMRSRNIRDIPVVSKRRGGKRSYAEWAHVIGIFQTLFHNYCEEKSDTKILDIGCGTGLLGIASRPFVQGKGEYVGIDVIKSDVEFCRNHFPSSNYRFIHFDLNNPLYSPSQVKKKQPWPVENESFDIVSALSVWTHLDEQDSIFYFQEIRRVLKYKGKAVVTFFILDDKYNESLKIRNDEIGRFHGTSQKKWIFDKSAYDSRDWFYPKWAMVPEKAIGITEHGLNKMLDASGLLLLKHYHGNWKEIPGLFFQDILVFEKS